MTLILTERMSAVGEPLRTRVPAEVGRLAVVAARLHAGVFLFSGGGVVQDLLAAAGVAALAVIWPPLREALHRGAKLLVGGSPSAGEPEATDDEPSRPALSPTTHCAHCADRSAVTAGSLTVE